MERQELKHQEEQQLAATHEASTRLQEGRTFANVEEMLRFDAAQNTPPEALGGRVQQSIAAEPAPAKNSWWQRLFGAS